MDKKVIIPFYALLIIGILIAAWYDHTHETDNNDK